jgi:ABC-type antimicrobial peptide transport system permease subunit
VIAGGVLGIAGAVASSAVVKSMLYGVAAVDPATYAVAILTLVAVAVAACAIPARRAMRVDPMIALRED